MKNPFTKKVMASCRPCDQALGLPMWGLWLSPDDMTQEKAEYAAHAINQHDKLIAFLNYFVSQEDMTFAECSLAEDLWRRAKALLSEEKD